MHKKRPFVIQILVADGEPEGLRLVEKSNWVGLGMVCPRGHYPDARKRPEFEQSGVYLLIGESDEDGRPMLYVGEGETVRTRLDAHHANKDFWQEAIVFTTKGEPLNKAEIKYLESSLLGKAIEVKRCRIDNSTGSQGGSLSEADRARIDGYLDEMLSLLPVLGVSAFEPVEERGTGHVKLFLTNEYCEATGFVAGSHFVVEKGSFARKETVPSMAGGSTSNYAKRMQLIEDGLLDEQEDRYVLTETHAFSSPSQASSVFLGRSSNGRTEWKNREGKSLKELQQLEAGDTSD